MQYSLLSPHFNFYAASNIAYMDVDRVTKSLLSGYSSFGARFKSPRGNFPFTCLRWIVPVRTQDGSDILPTHLEQHSCVSTQSSAFRSKLQWQKCWYLSLKKHLLERIFLKAGSLIRAKMEIRNLLTMLISAWNGSRIGRHIQRVYNHE